MMRGEEFLDVLHDKHLVPRNLIGPLRTQVESSDRPITAAAVARVFVESGHLTAFQARQIIAGEDFEAQPAATSPDMLELPGPDFDLAPLEEESQRYDQQEDSLDLPAIDLSLDPLTDPLDSLDARPPQSTSLEHLVRDQKAIFGRENNRFVFLLLSILTAILVVLALLITLSN